MYNNNHTIFILSTDIYIYIFIYLKYLEEEKSRTNYSLICEP